MDFIEAKFANLLRKIAHRSNIGASLVSACLIFCFALVIFTPSLVPSEHGVLYTEKSMMPLNLTFPSLVQLRFFAPLLGATLGFSGENFVYFPLLCMFFMLALTCHFLLISGFSPLAALLGTACIGLSAPMSTLLQFPGYVDAVAYLFVLLAVVQIRNTAHGSRVWGLSMAFAMLTHEATITLMPFMVWLAIDANRSDWRRQLRWMFLNTILALLPLALFRGQVSATGALAANWYLSSENIFRVLSETYAYIPIGIFFSFKVYWVFVVLALYFALSNRDYWFALGIGLGLSGVSSQLLVAYDTSRLMGLAFPLLIISQIYVSQVLPPGKFLRFLGILLVIQVLIPHYYVGGTMLLPQFPLIITIFFNNWLNVP